MSSINCGQFFSNARAKFAEARASLPEVSAPKAPKLTKGQKIGAGVGGVALAALLAVGIAAAVIYARGGTPALMHTAAQIKATTLTAVKATGALAAKVGAFIKAHYHYFIMGGAAATLFGLGGGMIYSERTQGTREAPQPSNDITEEDSEVEDIQ